VRDGVAVSITANIEELGYGSKASFDVLRSHFVTLNLGGKMKSLIPVETIEKKILHEKVMLDSDLAMLYGVETREIVQAVKRNIGRFPDDFML
jgi:hypothetical protein